MVFRVARSLPMLFTFGGSFLSDRCQLSALPELVGRLTRGDVLYELPHLRAVFIDWTRRVLSATFRV